MTDLNLLRELQLVSTRLSLINEIAALTLTHPEPNATWQVLNDKLQWLLPVHGLYLIVVGDCQREWTIYPAAALPPVSDAGPPLPAPSGVPTWLAGGIVAECLARRALLHFPDLATVAWRLAPLETQAWNQGACALAAAPLSRHDAVVGVLVFWSRQVDAFDFEALRTINLLLPHVTNALTVAQLLDEAEH